MSNPIFHSQYTAEQIEALIEHGTPIIQSGTWWTWDVSTMAYVDTGVSAEGAEAWHGIADDFSDIASYAVGDLVIYNGELFVCTTAHTGAWDATHFAATTVAAQLKTFEDDKSIALGAYPHAVASGAVASFADGADGIPVRSLTVQIVPVQAGSGDPSPSNPRAISGWTGANITRCGENLWNGQYQNGSIDIETGEDTSGSTVIRSIGFIPVLPSTVMYQSKGNTGAGYWYYYDKDKNYLSYIDAKNAGEYTTPENAYFLRFIHARANFLPNEYGVSFANQATAYSPYSGTVYPVSWQTEAGTVYGGTLRDNGDGTWTLTDENAGILLPTFVDADIQSGQYGHYIEYKPASINYPASRVTPTCGEVLAPTSYLGRGADWTFTTNNQGGLLIYVPDALTIEEINTALSGTRVVYPLYTPRSYTITADSVRTILGTNNIFADCGDVSVDYLADTTLYIDGKVNAIMAAIAEL